MSASPQRPARRAREELVNALTHGLGLLIGAVGAVLLVLAAVRDGAVVHVVACSVFGGSVVLLYLASTLYHAARLPRTKRLLRLLDHSAIYLLIAGTYTPFCLAILGGAIGWTLFGIVWGVAVLGVVYKLRYLGRWPHLSLVTYVLMGWLGVIAIGPTLEAVPPGGLALLLGGGAAYMLGVPFYVLDVRIPFGHAIWHAFVLAGTGLHFAAVFGYAIP